jgi:hypothetical protein
VGLLDRLLGREERPRQAWNAPGPQAEPAQTDDERAIERYRYMLRTAPPEQVEQAHAEAFEKLTPQQRQQVLAELSAEVPPGERAQSDDPRSLARMATRAEMRQPGTMERVLGGGGRAGGIGMGGLIAGGLLASVAGAFIGTAIADAMFDFNDSGEGTDASADGGGDGGSDSGGGGGDAAGDSGGYGDAGGFDGGGSDFGGGDFGGGDFGGF